MNQNKSLKIALRTDPEVTPGILMVAFATLAGTRKIPIEYSRIDEGTLASEVESAIKAYKYVNLVTVLVHPSAVS